MTTETLLDKLGRLSQQRSVRTDRLHELVKTLCSTLDKHTRYGDCATVNGATLCRELVRSNVGAESYWVFASADGESTCYPERGVDSCGFLHGDFHCELQGPRRADLIALASRAEAFVEALIKLQQIEVTALSSAAESVEHAIGGLTQ